MQIYSPPEPVIPISKSEFDRVGEGVYPRAGGFGALIRDPNTYPEGECEELGG